jgi:exopolyphosphatase/guanosine-5'-triphosphate,3'-diphosphate pyrophosphatase
LSEYRQLLDAHGVEALRAVGTSALRDAEHGAEFLERARQVLGVRLEVISGEREAALTFAGALSGLGESGQVFVFDIGGGSTELVWGVEARASSTRISRSTSLALGSVRLHERFAIGDTPEPERMAALRAHVRATLRGYATDPAVFGPTGTVIGVAGTVTSLAALELGMTKYDGARVHGAELSRQAVADWSARLAALDVDQRMQLSGLDRGRADVIVSGAALCAELMDWLGAERLRASDRGVRYGLLQELARGDAD